MGTQSLIIDKIAINNPYPIDMTPSIFDEVPNIVARHLPKTNSFFGGSCFYNEFIKFALQVTQLTSRECEAWNDYGELAYLFCLVHCVDPIALGASSTS